nr:TRIC cation channel family protein [Sodalis-like endosymbiont of Proechinophthirus fluctus]
MFAIYSGLLAGKLRIDPFGMLVLSVVTAVVGSTIHNIVLSNEPVFE